MTSSRAAQRVSAPEQRIAQRYVVESEIARGGMGVVYRVREQASGAVYALKRIRLDARPEREVLLAAFEREYQVLASLDHPGIIRVFDYGVDGDQPYYTMELVEGRDLRQIAPIGWRDACRHLRDVASALSLLHARRLVHRDLSPGNVKVTPRGRSKLLDFGALTDFGYPKWIVGTPPLVSPEMLSGGMLDQRTDLYALGALAYWLMTGRHAYPVAYIDDLPRAWRTPPAGLSAHDRAIPVALDALVMSLLSANPLARPASAAEVIAFVEGIAELAPEDEQERQRLARSFLAAPPFVGRDVQLATLSEQLGAAVNEGGRALIIQGPAGSGRSRLLEEAGVRAQTLGATVLRVDASTHRGPHGTSRALTARLFEALPEAAVRHGRRFRGALAVLGEDMLAKLGDFDPEERTGATQSRTLGEGELADFFFDVTRTKPLVVQVDNAEYADPVSVGLLATLAGDVAERRLLLMVVERSDRSEAPALGMEMVRERSRPLGLPPLSALETLALVTSMFGDAPHGERFAEWLHGHTAGNPLLSVETARQLVERGEVRYEAGMWVLPVHAPSTHHSALLDDVLSARIAQLSPAALDLARCLGLSRIEPTFALCARIADAGDEHEVRRQLDELARCDVMQLEQGTYRFSSVALREVLLGTTSHREHQLSHRRLGRALLVLAGADAVMRMEAGWHLIRGGSELEGADLINDVMREAVLTRQLNANMYRIGAPLEAALDVFKRHRRAPHARVLVLCALANAGFFEHHGYDVRHGDDALDVIDEISGMRLARKLRFLGKHLALYVALSVAVIRFYLTPRRERPMSFRNLLVLLFGTVLSGVAVAAIKLDGDRAERVAGILEPFTALPARLTAPSLYRFCHGLQEVAREHQVEAFRAFEQFVTHLGDPRHFRMVPADARIIFLCAAHFARGAFAIFRDDGRAALESAAVLETSGLRVYAMVGTQLRYLYHLNRGELAEAEPHRARVELHAAHFGSSWQVETWEPAALLPLFIGFDDATGVARLAHRLDVLSREVPSLRRYARLSALAASGVRAGIERRLIRQGEVELSSEVPRSFIGWSASMAVLARGYNGIGDPGAALACCERVFATMSAADREYVRLFLAVDLQAALAEAGLGRADAALARLDGLVARFQERENPMTLGSLHDVRARIAWQAGRVSEYERSLDEVERWFGRSSTPALVAKYERLRELQRPADTARGRVRPANENAPSGAVPDLADLDTEI